MAITKINLNGTTYNIGGSGDGGDGGGLEAGSDTSTCVVDFDSEDAENPTSETSVELIKSGETHASLFNKLSIGMKNIRYLLKQMGSTDISSVGNSVTDAIINLDNQLEWEEL